MRRGFLFKMTVAGLMAGCYMAALAGQDQPKPYIIHHETPDASRILESAQSVDSVYRQRNPGQQLVDAARNGQVGTVEELLKRTAPHQRDQDARTALHYAALNGHAYIAEKLVQHTADINAIDNEGKTPLHLAAEKGHSEMVKTLLRFGARQDIRDNAGLKPMDYAMRNGHSMVTHALMQAARPPQSRSHPAAQAKFGISFAGLFVMLIGGMLFLFLLGKLVGRVGRRKPGVTASESLGRLRQMARLAERMEARIVNLETILLAQETHGGSAGKLG